MSGKTDGPNWAEMFRNYVRAGFPPGTFWSLTPPEFYLAFSFDRGTSQPMTRSDLEMLAARFPDKLRREPNDRYDPR